LYIHFKKIIYSYTVGYINIFYYIFIEYKKCPKQLTSGIIKFFLKVPIKGSGLPLSVIARNSLPRRSVAKAGSNPELNSALSVTSLQVYIILRNVPVKGGGLFLAVIARHEAIQIN
jgi:hypothetical protein